MAVELTSLLAPIQMGDKSGGDYLQIDEDGHMWFMGASTDWTDISVPMTPTIRGVRDKPDYDENELGLLFPQNDTTEYVGAIRQFLHEKQLETDIYPHIHYVQSTAAQPTFILEYRWYNNGEAVPASWVTLSTADGSKGVFAYTSGSIMQIASFPAITALAGELISSHFEAKLYRNDNDVAGDVLVKYFDIHYRKDALGSKTQFTKL